jgi:DnaJ like chaperone protein
VLQLLKHTPRWFAAAAHMPQSMMAGLRYRVQRWMVLPCKLPSESILNGLSAQTQKDEAFRHIAFTFAVIALSARVACADGPLTREKYIAFRESFPLKGGVCGKIRNLFTLACANTTPFDHYVTQVKYMYPGKTELFSSLVERLFRIAAADGIISREEESLLGAIATMLDISPAEFADIRSRYDRPSKAHQVLGVGTQVTAATLKKRYHELMRHYHPDRFATDNLSPELQLLLKLKASEINAAYRVLAKRAA